MSDAQWQKSSFSTQQANCLELMRRDDVIGLRESDTAEVVVTTNRSALRALLLSVKSGQMANLS